MDYDETILECIRNKYKTVREISLETKINYGRVGIRLKMLQKYELVDDIQCFTNSRGVKPLKFKSRPN